MLAVFPVEFGEMNVFFWEDDLFETEMESSYHNFVEKDNLF